MRQLKSKEGKMVSDALLERDIAQSEFSVNIGKMRKHHDAPFDSKIDMVTGEFLRQSEQLHVRLDAEELLVAQELFRQHEDAKAVIKGLLARLKKECGAPFGAVLSLDFRWVWPNGKPVEASWDGGEEEGA